MRFIDSIVLLLLSFSVLAQSEHYNFAKLDTYTGLSNNQVTAILKDADGFVWIGTKSGLDRYDGYSVKSFRKRRNDSSSLLDNRILSLYELPDGRMWVSTSGGSCIYDSYTEKFTVDYPKYLQTLGLPSGSITRIIKGNNGRYWFIYDNPGLYLYSAGNRSAKPFKPDLKTGLSEKIAFINETNDEKLWLLYQNGFMQEYDIKSSKVVFSTNALEKLANKGYPNSFFIDNDGDIWSGYYTYGAFLFHPPDGSIRNFSENSSPKLSSSLVTGILQDNSGLIWITTDHGGVTLIDKKNNFRTSHLLTDPKDAKSLSHNSITAVFKDDKGIIWLGTYKQGINYLRDNIAQFPHYHHREASKNSLQYDDVNRFVEDRSGNLWIGTNGGGLIYFDRKNNTFKQYLQEPGNNNSLSSNVIVSLWIDHEGLLWIGTYFGGLDSFDGKKFTHYRHNDNDSTTLANDNVWEIYEDREGNLWIGTLGNGMDLFDRKTGRFKHNRSGAAYGFDYISAIMEDRKGNLWVGTAGGIIVYEKNNNTPVFYQHTSDPNSLGTSEIYCLVEDSKGRIWVGGREGLSLYNDETKNFRTFTTSDGFPDIMVLDMLEDNQGTFWFSTPDGLYNAILHQKDKGLSFSVFGYDETNNLQGREFNENAAFKTKDGELIFGGPSGFNIINPSVIHKTVYHPDIVFTGLQILNNNIEPGELVNGRVLLQQSLSKLQGIDLKYKENVFSLEFASLDFAHSTREKYAYMLDGFNSDWLYADGSQRRATYTNLGPGHYTFKIKALDRDGVWSKAKSLQINIDPPFWRTTIAYIVYVLLLAGLLLIIRRVTIERIQMRFEVQQQRREKERAHALDQLKTKFFTNVSHEFRTPLSLIIAPLDKIIKNAADEEQKKQLGLVQRNAKRLLNLVNQLLDFRKMEVQEIRLHSSIGDIIRFSRDISHSFTDIAEKKNIQFSFSSNIDSLEVYFDKDKIEKILFNLLSNAFKYTQDNGIVSINLTYNPGVNAASEGTIAIEVKDNGIGIPPDKHEKIFERFFQTDLPENMANQGTGIGLAITKEFVKLHGGVITVKSELEHGTCFTVVLPAKKINESSARAVNSPMAMEDVEQILLEESQKGNKKKKILIVEDNEDLRFYLKDNLKGQYHVEEAFNGKEGWEKIKQLNPDLVVSDIMMPLMDGVELARKIKTETLTAHIPVILLSAMGSEEKQLEGLKVGVNDYITKPFTFEILASRIRNLLAQQKILQKRFQKQIEVNPAEVTVTSVDEKFLQQALEVVEKQIDNPDFSVEDFSQAMFMNRVTLYRKILSITGKTPLEFVRSIRLKRAAQLLEKSGKTVAEVAYEVGFNTPKHFTKFFKEEFRVTPSQYVADKKDRNV